MNRFVFTVIVLSSISGQAQYWEWAKQNNGGVANAYQSASDGKGNLYVTIDANGTVTYGMQTFNAETILAKHNVSGQVLWGYPLNGMNEIIDLSHYPKGIFFVELLTPKVHEVKKIVVE